MFGTPLPERIEDADACITSRFVQHPDSTAVDLAPIGADATGEIEAIDIIEVITPGSVRARTSRVPVVVLTPREPMRPPSSFSTERNRIERVAEPSSIAPMALDVAAPRVSFDSLPSWSPTGSTTMELASLAGVPRFSSRMVQFGTSVAALCLVAGLVGAVLGYEGTPQESTTVASAPTSFHAPRTTTVIEAREEITFPPPDAPGKAVPAAPLSVASVAPVAAEAPDPLATTAAPPTTVAAPAPTAAVAAPHPHGTTGVLRVPGPVGGALIDGVPHRVDGNSLTVTCGHHRVKLPGRAVRNVDVPCGGSASF